MSGTRTWPEVTCRPNPNPAALTRVAYLVDLPVRPTGRRDAHEATHTRLRCTGLNGDRIHRLDSARGLKFYTTACGLRVAKCAGVLTAAEPDCQHHGCRRREDGAA